MLWLSAAVLLGMIDKSLDGVCTVQVAFCVFVNLMTSSSFLLNIIFSGISIFKTILFLFTIFYDDMHRIKNKGILCFNNVKRRNILDCE